MSTHIRFRYLPKELVEYIRRERNVYEPLELEEKKNTVFIAHRGYSAFHRENSVASFRAAAEKSFFGIETDVHVTKDGKYIIIHDDITGRVAEKNMAVEETDFDTLRAIPLKVKNGEDTPEARTIPSLEEYINICKDYNKIAVLELKNHFEPACIKEIVEIIKKIGYLDNLIFISFDLPNLQEIKKIDENIKAQYLTTLYNNKLLDLLQENKLDLDIYYRELNKDRVAKLHELGIKVNCWTVDTLDVAQKLVDYGVDYITTNVIE